ncbi:protein 4.1b isoform X8 [Brienomyrus brachyistius]|uniref:protein 4.1b isoform X8 n=1 Tax=Brienomyrus brachyistius TaxID=42636 RepID=UPI0020B384CB|nr:protein 4.1b isoform X8 [Brienomyrus brachyistius]
MTTEVSVTGEAESQQQADQTDADQQGQKGPRPQEPRAPPEDPAPKSSRGLPRLLSSFLKRRSQYTEQEREPERELEGRPVPEDPSKAPIADPEPELRAVIDTALDLHSLSSAETQPAQEDRRDACSHKEEEEEQEEGREDARKGLKPSGREQEPGGQELAVQEEVKAPRETEAPEGPKAPRAPRQPRSMHCRVTLLDDTLYECDLDKHAKGQELLTKVCEHLNLLERDYFGLATWETATLKTWLDFTKEIRKQVQGSSYDFTFNVKFYPPDPAQLTEDITRYQLCLQLRKDILSGSLPCSFATLALLGSYAVQSELGEHDPDLHGADYVSQLRLAPGQSRDLEEKITELHRSYRSMSPAQADMMFLENAKKLSMYGVDLHQAKDLEGVDIMLGVCSSGLMVYKDKLRINRFPWPKVLKISYKRSSFFIKVRASEQEQYESMIGFKLPNYRASKKLWKVCVEHHTFFRLTSVEATTPRKFLALGSKFRYSGRTQVQTRQASSLINRPAPQFQRSASKRVSRSLDGAAVATPEKSGRPISAPVIPPATPGAPTSTISAAATIGVPVKPEPRKVEVKPLPPAVEPVPEVKTQREQRAVRGVTDTNGEAGLQQSPRADTEHVQMRKKRVKRVEGETIYIRHSNLMLEDLDRTQEVIMRHHASISELKRSFMEAMPEPQPSEWDKRLSTHSPFRSVSINGQLQPGDVSACSPRVGECCDDTLGEESSFGSIRGGAVLKLSDHDGSGVGSEHEEEEEKEEAWPNAEDPPGLCVQVEKATVPSPSPEPQGPGDCLLPGTEEQDHPPEAEPNPQCAVVGASPISCFVSEGPYLIRCFQPPLVKTQTVTISEGSTSLHTDISTMEVPIVHTQTKTITYESAQLAERDRDSDVLLGAPGITSEMVSSATTTQIRKTVKGGVSETRIEKRIVITGDSDIDHNQALAQVIKEAKEQHPDMSVTKVVVHQQTEVRPE